MAPEDREWPGGRDWWAWDRATGDWGGVRTDLESRGLSFEASQITDWFAAFDGGVSNAAASTTLVDVNATLDLEQAFGWGGASVFADFYWIDGNRIGGKIGDFQGASNIEGANRTQLSELWFEQTLLDGSLRFKIGKIEGNSEFAFVESAGEFVNSSAGFSPTIIALPSYPDPATGVVVSWSPTEWLSLTGGFFDGAATVDGVTTGDLGPASFFNDRLSNDYVWVGEADFAWEGGRAGVGVWHHTGDFARFSGGTDRGATGFYALAEHRVWSPCEERGLDLFAQFGWADDEISDAELHLACGAALSGVCDARPDDSAGVYVTYAALSAPAGYTDDETAVEVYYKFQVTPFAAVKPDLQLIFNPGGTGTVDDAIVGGLRFEIVY